MIIGIGHKKNMGKDTFANMLDQAFLNSFHMVSTVKSISDPLFNAGGLLFGWAGMKMARAYNEDYSLKEKELPGLPGVTPRDIAKAIGNLCRSVHPDSLVKAVIGNASENEVVIITNIRFPNEAKAVKDAGGILVKVTRPGVKIDQDDPFDTALDDWKDWDYEVLNGGTLDDLIVQAHIVAGFAKRKRLK